MSQTGLLGGDDVEVGGCDVAVFGEFAFVPTGAGDPFTGLQEGNFCFDAGYNLGH